MYCFEIYVWRILILNAIINQLYCKQKIIFVNSDYYIALLCILKIKRDVFKNIMKPPNSVIQYNLTWQNHSIHKKFDTKWWVQQKIYEIIAL